MSRIKELPRSIFLDSNLNYFSERVASSIIAGMYKNLYLLNESDSEENNAKQKNRSTAKTDQLHSSIGNIIGSLFGEFEPEFNKMFLINTESSNGGSKTKRIPIKVKDCWGKGLVPT